MQCTSLAHKHIIGWLPLTNILGVHKIIHRQQPGQIAHSWNSRRDWVCLPKTIPESNGKMLILLFYVLKLAFWDRFGWTDPVSPWVSGVGMQLAIQSCPSLLVHIDHRKPVTISVATGASNVRLHDFYNTLDHPHLTNSEQENNSCSTQCVMVWNIWDNCFLSTAQCLHRLLVPV